MTKLLDVKALTAGLAVALLSLGLTASPADARFGGFRGMRMGGFHPGFARVGFVNRPFGFNRPFIRPAFVTRPFFSPASFPCWRIRGRLGGWSGAGLRLPVLRWLSVLHDRYLRGHMLCDAWVRRRLVGQSRDPSRTRL